MKVERDESDGVTRAKQSIKKKLPEVSGISK